MNVLRYEKEMKQSYDKAMNFYNELRRIGERYQNNQDIYNDLVSFNNRLELAKLPIYESATLEMITTKYEPVSEQDLLAEVLTGAAAKIMEDENNAPKIAGVKRGEPMSFEEAGVGVNPHYNKGGGYHRNCQVCVAVFEARMRGYNIEALPLDENNEVMMELRHDPSLAFIDRNTNSFPKVLENPFVHNYEGMISWFNDIIKSDEWYGLICKIQPDIN